MSFQVIKSWHQFNSQINDVALSCQKEKPQETWHLDQINITITINYTYIWQKQYRPILIYIHLNQMSTGHVTCNCALTITIRSKTSKLTLICVESVKMYVFNHITRQHVMCLMCHPRFSAHKLTIQDSWRTAHRNLRFTRFFCVFCLRNNGECCSRLFRGGFLLFFGN